MNSFGFGNFNGISNENTFANLLKPYLQQPDSVQAISESQRGSGALYEINSQADIDYIEIDKSGRMQVFICQNEKRIYTRRYNHSKQSPDYKEYIEEEETKFVQKNDTSADMSKIADALVAVAAKLEAMHNEIQEFKKEPAKKELDRKPNGQFKKKGES